jgi:hypothetical protein
MFKVLHATIDNPPLIVKTLFLEHAFFFLRGAGATQNTGTATEDEALSAAI